jgi:dipeptidase
MRDNCTTMLVGKKASLDGSTIVDRDEDYDQGINSYNVAMSSAESEASNRRVFDGSQ